MAERKQKNAMEVKAIYLPVCINRQLLHSDHTVVSCEVDEIAVWKMSCCSHELKRAPSAPRNHNEDKILALVSSSCGGEPVGASGGSVGDVAGCSERSKPRQEEVPLADAPCTASRELCRSAVWMGTRPNS